MLSPSYAAFAQFQSQKKSIHSFQELKALLNTLDLALSIQVESSTLWKLEWDVEEGFSGTFEVGIQPRLSRGEAVWEAPHPIKFRLEQPLPMGLSVLERQLVELLKRALDVF